MAFGFLGSNKVSLEEQMPTDLEKYEERRKEGNEFEDFVSMELAREGLVVGSYSSRKYQIKFGENILGAEIKRDGKFRETKNLYIEIAEKSHANNPSYVTSGILRKDNSWLFIIGDEKKFFLFSKKLLKKLIDENPQYLRVQTRTSKGILLPVIDAERECDRSFEPVNLRSE